MRIKFDTPPKVGDKVIKGRSTYTGAFWPEAVLTVSKVTPSGIIRTEEGISYRPIKYSSSYSEDGRRGNSTIAPYSEELERQVAEYRKERERKQEARQTIEKAISACFDMADWNGRMSYETAVKILAVYDEWKKEQGKT